MRAPSVRRASMAMSWVCALALSAWACQSGSTTGSGAGGGADQLSGVRASVVQQRIDEGTRHIGIEVSVDPHTSLHVVGVQLKSAGFEAIPITDKDTTFAPGQVIDLTTDYGRPLCDGVDPTDGLSAVLSIDDATGDSRTYEIPVTGSGIGLIRRLHEAECARLALREAAPITYTTFHRARVDDEEVLVGALRLERPAAGGSGAAVGVDALLGSVLFDFRALADVRPGLVARLDAGQQVLRVPVRIGSSGRCDQHARSQSTQTFLFSAYVRVGSTAEHREILVPPPTLQRQALALLDDVC